MINSQNRSIYIEKVYMIDFNTEYFSNGNYFFLKDRGDKISLYYSNADTLTESRKNDDRMDFDKKNSKNVKTMINNILKSKKKLGKGDIKKRFDKAKTSGEIEELVDDDGTMLSSKIPNLNMALTPRKTMDQTVQMSRTTNDPVMRGYRVYYGEGKEGSDEVINEVDYSEAFGYEETKDMDFKNTVKTLKKMGVENAVERAREFGKLPNQKKEDGELRQRLSEKETLEERQHRLMKKMVEDILTKKPKTDSDVIKKDTGVSKILLKNIQSIKKIADKEGISVNMLIKALKSNE
jgi:hypothetical protein